MFFHAMGGRCGTIDTAIKTADSGYISRKLIKAAEDLMIHYDMTVRNASNNIIQFAYGDDNMDPTKLEKVNKIDLIEKNNEEIENMYKFDDLDKIKTRLLSLPITFSIKCLHNQQSLLMS